MYRTIRQLDELTARLARLHPHLFERHELPERSVENRPVHALRMRAGGGPPRRGVLLVGGTHARELMNPDAIVELAVDLLVSHTNGTDVVLGGRRWPASEIRTLLETLDLWLLPCLNPDGRHHVMTVDDMWRKNRRPDPGSGCVGVDLNRNADLLWGVTEGQTSCSPCTNIFCGPTAFSEPETRNVKHLLDAHRISCFADVHSFSELILHPWGHAPTQTTDPSQSFTTLPTGTCAPLGRPGYREWMPARDLQRHEEVGRRIVDAIRQVRGRSYTLQSGIGLYATTGTHSDYAYSRHLADPSLQKTYAYTFETGPRTGDDADSFHPADPEPVKLDAKAAMLTLAQQCICAIDLIGTRLLGSDRETGALRRVRDDLLATTEAGLGWIALVERVQGRLLEPVLADDRLAKEAAVLLRLAAGLVEDEGATVAAADAERAVVLLRELAERSDDEDVRADLEAAAAAVGGMAGRSSREAIEGLLAEPPKR